jgi:hypothetical protein
MLIALTACVVLLLNFTAPNPTGRRYSSESPLMTGQGSAQQIGLSAERVLARDLGIARNEALTSVNVSATAGSLRHHWLNVAYA